MFFYTPLGGGREGKDRGGRLRGALSLEEGDEAGGGLGTQSRPPKKRSGESTMDRQKRGSCERAGGAGGGGRAMFRPPGFFCFPNFPDFRKQEEESGRGKTGDARVAGCGRCARGCWGNGSASGMAHAGREGARSPPPFFSLSCAVRHRFLARGGRGHRFLARWGRGHRFRVRRRGWRAGGAMEREGESEGKGGGRQRDEGGARGGLSCYLFSRVCRAVGCFCGTPQAKEKKLRGREGGREGGRGRRQDALPLHR